MYGFKDSEHLFLERPTLIRDTPRLVFLSALYKYMTPVFPNPSAHQIVTDQWSPNDNDISTGNTGGFATTTNLFYGDDECNLGD